MFDLGSGAFANLRRHVDYDRIDAIVITHMHADHFIDVIPLRYALRYGSRRRERKLPLYLPPDGERMLHLLVSAFADEGGGHFLGEVYDIRTYDPAKPLAIGGGTLTFALTAHYIPAFAIRYQRNGCSVTYSADTAPSDRIVDLARETDLFVCESTLLADDIETGMRGHSTGLEAGRMAQAAGVRRLILTHYAESATARDLDESAGSVFTGNIMVADDHAVLEVRPTPAAEPTDGETSRAAGSTETAAIP